MGRMVLVVVGVLAGLGAAAAAPGDLDPTFGTAGKVTTPVGDSHAFALTLALQPDGKLVAGGQAVADGRTYMTLVRYAVDGTLDASFGTGGRSMTLVGGDDAQMFALVLQPDGKLVGAGQANLGVALARWNPDGTLDPTFGAGGTVRTSLGPSRFGAAYALVLQSDGKLVTAGFTSDNTTYQFALMRYFADGSLDQTFGTDGTVVTSVGGPTSLAQGIVQQVDGKLVAAGWWNDATATTAGPALARFDVDGQLDPTFGIGGTVISAPVPYGAMALLLQPDGKLIVVGDAPTTPNTPAFMIARYLADGSLDPAFATNGQITTNVTNFDQAQAVVLQSDGKIVVAGTGYTNANTDIALARTDGDGQLDPTFGTGGIVTTPGGSGYDYARAVVSQPDGKIVTAGYSYDDGGTARFALARYFGGGPCDDTPCTTTTTSTTTTSTTTTTLLCSGDATSARLVAARLTPPPGDDTLKLRGVVTIPTSPLVDPMLHGLRLLYGGRTEVVVDETVPPGAYDPVSRRGWIARNGTFRYANRSQAGGVRKVVVKAIAGEAGTYKVQLAGRNADYAVTPDDLPLHAIVVLDPPAAASGQCGEWRFLATPPATPSCMRNAAGTTIKCR